jgi:16S rRNA (cytidine1402-2'-O)-methyltransferase
MKSGTLTLIPTPIDESSKLSVEAFDILDQNFNSDLDLNSIMVVEDLKPARKRWLHFGLPRKTIEHFYQLNEHNVRESTLKLISELEKGKNVFLMSDGGLPAFCDPGQELVYKCHKQKIKVTSTPFSNSVILALALSGLSHADFFFMGFLPIDKDQRKAKLQSLMTTKTTTILMDTPYRLKRLLEELKELGPKFNRECFLALDLCGEDEELILSTPAKMLDLIKEFKREFVLIVAPT